ncbi:hypothetical protein [Enterovirga aerilata]|uniref:Uncharacterized protein n=1 Tax=Enterovirga aerilata TaxID=2730920 RepID=A0A849HZD7_9HYPH|nr:hypothetical protein [Enterovirga sp. DB1703]NNM72462.1 hypothetical protein [Enterovirga sp. DB1703]
MRLIPPKVKRECIAAGEDMSLTRPAFLQKVLFPKDGFGLKPRVFTKSTAELDKGQRVPSVSVKDHLPYFFDEPGDDGVFCRALKEYIQAEKLLSTYVDTRE